MSEQDRWRELEERYQRSPIHHALSLSLAVHEPGKVEIHYGGTPAAGNVDGMVAGAALAAMVDSAVLQACRTVSDAAQSLATLELKVNFIRPSPAGVPLVTTAVLHHDGRRTCVGTTETTDQQGRLIALGVVTGAKSERRAAGRSGSGEMVST